MVTATTATATNDNNILSDMVHDIIIWYFQLDFCARCVNMCARARENYAYIAAACITFIYLFIFSYFMNSHQRRCDVWKWIWPIYEENKLIGCRGVSWSYEAMKCFMQFGWFFFVLVLNSKVEIIEVLNLTRSKAELMRRKRIKVEDISFVCDYYCYY